ncbi:28 kDa ribonucleoprotein, chloroplastic-like [Vigna umbellata]|uniref:28 kDa ribonucleoprotein, chloroplastic-like n=1 Tax=Vigna umbellata TaxID=87088 RepID=UPI001F5FD56C|nr:28 kDa ribonucleoprotein, chloroplastic-like [Vigna umbellata]XP_047181963.1 28 kDa ribonucleoprotein, chloroplastic-like [Vigna umbellata]
MAATAAGIASLFSSSINNIKCLRSKHCSMMDPLMTAMPSNRMSHLVEPLSIGGTMSHRLWGPRISAAVAQEELVSADDAGFVEEEKVEDNEGEVVAEQDSDESFASTKLYFGNLPYSVDSAILAGLIQDYGSAELIEVLYDRDTGKSRGFAFVTMSCIEDCNTVIENLDGKEFMGRTLRVNFSNKPKAKEPLYPETEHKLFVGNLSWSVTNEILTQAFQEYGTVVGARVLYDGETGRSRGYGFVCFSTKAEMESALEALNDVELEGRAMRVSLAQGKRAQG